MTLGSPDKSTISLTRETRTILGKTGRYERPYDTMVRNEKKPAVNVKKPGLQRRAGLEVRAGWG